MLDQRRIVDLLAASALFRGQNPTTLAGLAAAMQPVGFAGGQLIFSRGDPGDALYLVVSGRVRLSILTPEGAELSFAHAVAGDVFGEIAALDGSPRSADATALADVTLLRLPAGRFEQLLAEHPTLARSVIRFLCRRVREVSDHFEDVALLPLEARIARYLLGRIDGDHGGRRDQCMLSLGFSQGELALLIGASRQKVNAALMSLEQLGAITRNGTAYVCDARRLERLAKRDGPS